VPTGLRATAATVNSITVAWTPSTDNVGVTGYRLYQNGTQVGTSPSPTYLYGGLSCGATYTLGVAAVDAAGNVSGTASMSVQAGACSTVSAASVFVAPSGSDSSCVRGDASRACATLQGACAKAQGGDTVEVAAGAYASQSVTCQPSSTVTFQPAAGASVTIAGGSQPWTDGLDISGRNLTLRNMTVTGKYAEWSVSGGASNINMVNMNSGRLNIGSASNVTVKGGNFGPYFDDQGSGGSHVGSAQATNIVIDGITMHDYTIPSGSGFHLDCISIWGGNGVTIEDSTFYNCNGFDVWMKGYPQVASATNVEIVNNVLRPNLGGTPQVVSLACNDAGAPLANVRVEYNSMGGELNVGNSPPCTSYTNVVIRANIMPQVNPIDCRKSGVSFVYNVVQANKCGTTDVVAPSGFLSSTDYHLGAGAAAIGRGDPAFKPDTDHDGKVRTSPTDAGAYQH
jgi:hypothetical protein